MKLKKDKRLDVDQSVRVMGEIVKSKQTICNYIAEQKFDSTLISINLLLKENVELHAVFVLYDSEPSPNFVFCDPSNTQKTHYSKVAGKLFTRKQILSYCNLDDVKLILDLIYLSEDRLKWE